MLRAEVEKLMKEAKLEQIDLVLKNDDKLAIYCRLKNGKLYDYTDHVVNRKINIYGYLKWENGVARRVRFDEVLSL